jgi:hypothetical protein
MRLTLNWDSSASQTLFSTDYGNTLVSDKSSGLSDLSLSNANPPAWWTMQFRECTYTIQVGRQWGPSFNVTVLSPAGSSFDMDGVADNKYCEDNNFGNGSNAIVNQAGVKVGEGTCMIEPNWIESWHLEGCNAAKPVSMITEPTAATAGSQLTVLIVLCSSGLVLAAALSYWRLKKRANCKCQKCMCWENGKECNDSNTRPVGRLPEIWHTDVSSNPSGRSTEASFGDGWDEPVLDEMPEDGVGIENDVDMEVDLAIIPVQDDGLAAIPPTYEEDSQDDEDIDVERDSGKCAQQPCWEL